MKPTRTCASCGKPFVPCPQVPNQRFCSAPECQRRRRTQWQHEKLQSDSDYRENQARARSAWLARNPSYWQRYRKMHPAYEARNRALQHPRNLHRSQIAKMDALLPGMPFPSGVYVLQRHANGEIAKMDEWIVHILELPRHSVDLHPIAKR